MTDTQTLERVRSFRQWLIDRHREHQVRESVRGLEGDIAEQRRQQTKAQMYEAIIVRLDEALND